MQAVKELQPYPCSLEHFVNVVESLFLISMLRVVSIKVPGEEAWGVPRKQLLKKK